MMKSLSVALALATVAGCAAAPAGTEPGDDSPGSNDPGGSDPGSGGDDTPTALDASGKYQMASTFDLATNMPGTVGTVANTIIDMTDGGDDPAAWIVEQLINALPDGTIKNIAQNAAPFVTGYLNDQLLSIAPDFVNTGIQLGKDFGDMAKKTGLISTLEVTKSGGGYTSVHTVTGVHFNIEGVNEDFSFADYDVNNIVVPNVGIDVDATGKFNVGQHSIPLQYGTVLRIGLDNAIIPLLDPSASNLSDLLHDQIDCAAVGQAVADAVGFGSESLYEGACNTGLDKAADLIYQKIADIDGSVLQFDMSGKAKGVDTNNDGKLDKIQTGKWDGTASYAGTPAPLSAATFNGSRM